MLFEQLEEKTYIHEELRPHQAEVLDTIASSDSRYIVLEASTGAGKSFFPAQLAAWGKKTMALVKTKSLQDQYHRPPYQATVVKGKSNYDCDLGMMPDASLCEMTRKERAKNGCLEGCPYYQACSAFLGSELGCLNYSKYFLESRSNGLATQYEPQYLFLDEAHQLSDLVIDYSGFSQPFTPFLLSFITPVVISPHLPRELAIDKAIDWLSLLYQGLMDKEPAKPDKHSSAEQIRYYKRWDNLCRKVGTTIDLVESGKEYWYAESTDERGFRLKPLTARFHFPQLFNAPKVVLMSATVGNAKSFMAELGIYENFQEIVVPNIWPPASRPIVDLDGPKMNYKNTPAELEHHADVIGRALDDCPSDWTGIIHVNSKAKAQALKKRLLERTCRPLWTPQEGEGTEQVLQSWLSFRKKRGAIGIGWQMWEGVDLRDDKIVIVGWLPWSDFSDPYEKERFDFDKKAALGRVANNLVQGLGRTRRGRKEDYEPGAGFVGIADSNWHRVQSFINGEIREAIR